MTEQIHITPLPGIGEIHQGTDLATVAVEALERAGLHPTRGDVLVVAQKIVSKAEGRYVDLRSVEPGAEAIRLAEVTGKDARLVQLILDESDEVVRAVPNVLIVRHRRGFVMANAGIDRSNAGPQSRGAEPVLLLPADPDGSAARLREALGSRLGVAPGVIISDSFGRPWRNGTVNIALGAAGVAALEDRRGTTDRDGRTLEATVVAHADALAAAAGLALGEAEEGVPMALVQGWTCRAPETRADALLRPLSEDLFR